MKRFLTMYLPLVLLVGAMTAYLGLQLGQSRQTAFEANKAAQLEASKQLLLHDLSGALRHLQGLAQESTLQKAFGAPPDIARQMEEDALRTLLQRNPHYAQARWIDANGMELVRADRLGAANVALVAPERLQNKSDRSYVTDTLVLQPGQMYISALDLNIEHGQIEVPHRPMLRATLRLPTAHGRDQGMLIINISAQQLLDDYTTSTPANHGEQRLLLNDQGQWLLAPDPRDNWGHLLGNNRKSGLAWPQHRQGGCLIPVACGFGTASTQGNCNPTKLKSPKLGK